MLSSLQRRIVRLVAQADPDRVLVLAGGAALIVRGIVDRKTRDIDLFAASESELAGVGPQIERALVDDGLRVRRVQDHDGFIRLEVTYGRDSCIVDLGVDVRLLPVEASDGIAILALKELAADKVLALFDRAEARDFVDVYALAERFGRQTLVDLAREKDAGFDESAFSVSLASIDRLPLEEFDVPVTVHRRIRAFAIDWANDLR